MERRLAQIEESVARYLHQLDSADRQEPSLARTTKTTRLTEKIARLKEEMERLHALEARMIATPDQQISLTDPDSRSMATSGRGSGVVRYNVQEDVYSCPAGERLAYAFTAEENGLVLRRYSTNACRRGAIKQSCTTGKKRRITRWKHEHLLEAVQRRLDEHPEKMRQRRETVEHPFGTIKARMGATHFLMKTLPRVAAEMALHVLAYNLTRVMNIIGVQPLIAAMRA